MEDSNLQPDGLRGLAGRTGAGSGVASCATGSMRGFALALLVRELSDSVPPERLRELEAPFRAASGSPILAARSGARRGRSR